MTLAGQIILTGKVNTVFIPLTGGRTIELYNVTLTPKYDSNLISLRQLQESAISYYDNLPTMILMRGKEIIANTKRDHNMFTLEIAVPR